MFFIQVARGRPNARLQFFAGGWWLGYNICVLVNSLKAGGVNNDVDVGRAVELKVQQEVVRRPRSTVLFTRTSVTQSAAAAPRSDAECRGYRGGCIRPADGRDAAVGAGGRVLDAGRMASTEHRAADPSGQRRAVRTSPTHVPRHSLAPRRLVLHRGGRRLLRPQGTAHSGRPQHHRSRYVYTAKVK